MSRRNGLQDYGSAQGEFVGEGVRHGLSRQAARALFRSIAKADRRKRKGIVITVLRVALPRPKPRKRRSETAQ